MTKNNQHLASKDVDLNEQLKILHTHNAQQLHQMEERMQTLMNYQVEWLMEKNKLLSKLEEAHQRINYLTLLLGDTERQQQTMEQQIQMYHRGVIQLEDEMRAERVALEQQLCCLAVERDEWQELYRQECHHNEQTRIEEQDTRHLCAQYSKQLQESQRNEKELMQQLADLQQELLQMELRHSHSSSSDHHHDHHRYNDYHRSDQPNKFQPNMDQPLCEEIVELSEEVDSLKSQLRSCRHQLEQHQLLAPQIQDLQQQVNRLTSENRELRIVCGSATDTELHESYESRYEEYKRERQKADRQREEEEQQLLETTVKELEELITACNSFITYVAGKKKTKVTTKTNDMTITEVFGSAASSENIS